MEESTSLLPDPDAVDAAGENVETVEPVASESDEAEPEREDVMAKYTVKDGAGCVQHNGKTYGSGDKIELTESEAVKIAHALKDGDDLKAKAAKG